ncbi:ABC-type transport system, involved in lipoprotein release, permease component [Reichenbachiella faecimaris]|uniref:ABC-type transport system, involved in lipoprotein release, permease component n=1 Tax=Reichenbachiella faecimaris TaxID=692418 RepID=A0A1W2G5Q5_REIFA|nr:FtsX-like permease family protein [Reichenbachiella faecimaris]SMD31864.1 ABC-type transport system, involved in lipoprotein release, permease component [Reichenbachiella faecimaris]
MFKNYLKTIYRNIKREKLFTMLNLSGLGLGLGCVLVIFKIITYEISFDKHHSNYDNIYRIVRESKISSGISYNEGVPHPVGEALRADYPDLKVVRTHYEPYHQLAIKREDGEYDRYQDDEGLVFAESSVFQIFDFEFIEGNPNNCLDEPNSIVLSRSQAKKLFSLNDANLNEAMGRQILFANELDLTVKGLVEDYKVTTNMPFNVFVHYEHLDGINPYYRKGNWGSNSSATNCYVLVPDNYDVDNFEELLVGFVEKYHGEGASIDGKYLMQPLSDIHFSEKFDNYNEKSISMEFIKALGVIGIFLIITAAINFINLTTAQSIKRAKEIGIRKTLGGKSYQLAIQFLSETLIITLISSFIGLIFAEVLLIYLEDILGYKLWINLFEEPNTLLFLVINILIIGLLAGIYPALSMSKLNPIAALRTKFNVKDGSGFLSFRRVLVIVQFIITQVLIIGTIVVQTQMDFFLNKDLGFTKDNIILTDLPNKNEEDLKRLKTNLLSNPNVKQVSFTLSAPMGTSNSNSHISHHSIPEGENVRVNFKFGDKDFLDMYGLKLVVGEWVEKTDTSRILVNRKLAEALGYSNPEDVIGEKIGGWYRDMQVVGVVENFHTHSLHQDFAYCIFMNNPRMFYEMAVKINSAGKGVDEVDPTLAFVQKEWEKVFNKDIYDFYFFDKQVADWYEEEKNMGSMFKLFSIIAIFIGCLGLYGLISYIANKKTKEIGVRKVLGASTFNVLQIFSKEMVILVFISFIVAGPVSYIVMNDWLDNFAYKIELSYLIFAIALLISFGIAICTAGYKAIMAARANPVLSLKDE